MKLPDVRLNNNSELVTKRKVICDSGIQTKRVSQEIYTPNRNYSDLKVMSKKDYEETLGTAVHLVSEPEQQEVSFHENPFIHGPRNMAVSMIQTLAEQRTKSHCRRDSEGK